MRIIYAVAAVLIYIVFMAGAYKTSPDSLCGNDAFWVSVAIVAAGAMAGGD